MQPGAQQGLARIGDRVPVAGKCHKGGKNGPKSHVGDSCSTWVLFGLYCSSFPLEMTEIYEPTTCMELSILCCCTAFLQG